VIPATQSVSAQEYGYTYGAQSGTLYRVTIPSGNTEAIAGGPLPPDIESFAVSSNGTIYALSTTSDELFSVDAATGTTSNLGPIEVGPDQYPTGLAFDGDGRLLMLANANPQSALYAIDLASAEATFVTWINSNEVTHFAISGTSCYARGAWYGNLFSIDISTGDVMELPNASTYLVHDLSFDGSGQLWGTEIIFDPHFGCEIKHLVRFNLDTGEHIRVTQLPVANGECFWPLAIQTDQTISISTQGPVGLTVLVLLIAGLGFALLIGRRNLST